MSLARRVSLATLFLLVGCGEAMTPDAGSTGGGGGVTGPRCGDGTRNGKETCDDGNNVAGDGCSPICAVDPGYSCTNTGPDTCVTTCGDGERAGAEACDDRNTAAGDGCSPRCEVETGFTCSLDTPNVCKPTCGDGLRVGTETCDDGDLVGDDGCSATCALETGFSCSLGTPNLCTAVCGDGRRLGAETCDDGNLLSGDGCSATCVREQGFGCSQATPNVCSITCGDGVKASIEACDDGNLSGNDGCSSSCTREAGFMCTGELPTTCAPICGDGVRRGAEACDDGNTTARDGCSAMCALEVGYTCTGAPSVCVTTCGDGFRAGVEACDDGNTRSTDGCTATCTLEVGFTCDMATPNRCAPICGDGLRRPPESCDDDNTAASDGCSETCSIETGYACVGEPSACATVCGDGNRVGAESCDDGNTTPGDGCSRTCVAEAGYACTTATPNVCTAVCGDGLTRGPEACDDGNTMPGDGCSATCTVEFGHYFEHEPNDDGATAEATNDFLASAANGPFIATVVLHAAIQTAGDDDVFALRNPTSSSTTVRVDVYSAALGLGVPCEVTTDTVLMVRDAAGTLLATNDDRVPTVDRCSALDVVIPGNTTRYLQLIELGDNNVLEPYLVRVVMTPVVCGDGIVATGEECDGTPDCTPGCLLINGINEAEPNNTLAQPNGNFTASGFVRGALNAPTDVDTFRLTLTSAQTLRFETFAPLLGDCDTTNTTLRLRDQAGTEVFTDNTSGITSCSALVATLGPGTWFVQVEENGQNAIVPAYRLQVSFGSGRGSEVEFNDDFSTATPLALSAGDHFIEGTHQVDSDSDMFALTLSTTSSLRAELIEANRAVETCESLGIDSRLTLFHASGTLLADDDDEGRGYCSLIDGTGSAPLHSGARQLVPGTYYLQVRSAQPGATGQFDYRLFITVR